MTRFCGVCGRAREEKTPRCKECGSPLFSITETITHRNWLRKHKKIRTTEIIVTGPANFDDQKFFILRMNSICRKLQDIFIYTGGGKGIDKMAGSWAQHRWYSYVNIYACEPGTKPTTDMLLRRNEELLSIEEIKAVIVFHDGEDRACQHLIVNARKKKGIQVKVIYYD
jgi:hypothetical protein